MQVAHLHFFRSRDFGRFCARLKHKGGVGEGRRREREGGEEGKGTAEVGEGREGIGKEMYR